MTNVQIANTSSPVAAGYAMPAEWERHEATWLAWPHHEADWPGKMEAVRWVYGEMVRKIAPGRNRTHSRPVTRPSRNLPPTISSAQAVI